MLNYVFKGAAEFFFLLFLTIFVTYESTKGVLRQLHEKSGAFERRKLSHTPKNFSNRIASFAVTEEFIATANNDGDVQIFSRDFFHNFGTLPNCCQNQKSRITALGRLLITTDSDRNKISLWDIRVPSITDRCVHFSCELLQVIRFYFFYVF